MKYLITKFIEEEDLPLFSVDNIPNEWKDGIDSMVANHKGLTEEETLKIKRYFKNNLESTPDSSHLFKIIDSKPEWAEWCAAKTSTNPMVTRTGVGGYYRPHHDNWDVGDFSTTIFLNDPSEYDGGELCLWVNGEEYKFKLKAGYGITYETGIPHCVNEVTRGERQVCIFWTTSHIKNFEDLYKFRYYNLMCSRYKPKHDIIHLKDFVNDPHAHFFEKLNKIKRKYFT